MFINCLIINEAKYFRSCGPVNNLSYEPYNFCAVKSHLSRLKKTEFALPEKVLNMKTSSQVDNYQFKETNNIVDINLNLSLGAKPKDLLHKATDELANKAQAGANLLAKKVGQSTNDIVQVDPSGFNKKIDKVRNKLHTAIDCPNGNCPTNTNINKPQPQLAYGNTRNNDSIKITRMISGEVF